MRKFNESEVHHMTEWIRCQIDFVRKGDTPQVRKDAIIHKDALCHLDWYEFDALKKQVDSRSINEILMQLNGEIS